MPSEPDPPPSLFKRNRLRLKFNFENIFRKYEKMNESGVEVDLEEDAFYIAKNTERRLANKTKQLFYAANDNWGLCPISAPFNDIENLECNRSLQQKCAKRDQEFNGEILAVMPYKSTDQPTLTTTRKVQETTKEETYTAEGVSVADLESAIRENGVTGEIFYRGAENNYAVIKVRYLRQIGFIDDTRQQPLGDENLCDEVTREFENARRESLGLPLTPALPQPLPLLAIAQPPSVNDDDDRHSGVHIPDEVECKFAQIKRESSGLSRIHAFPQSSSFVEKNSPSVTDDRESNRLSKVDIAEEVTREFANARRESLGSPLTQTSSYLDTTPANDDIEDTFSGVQMPIAPINRSYKRGGSSLGVSPKSKKSCQRNSDETDEIDEVFKEILEKNTSCWSEESATSLYNSYLSASGKLRSVLGVDKKDLDECPPVNSLLIDYWVNSTAFWKEKAPSAFTCEFLKHEERRQFSAARERNHHLQYGFR